MVNDIDELPCIYYQSNIGISHILHNNVIER